MLGQIACRRRHADRTLADYLVALDKVPGIAIRRARAEAAVLRTRLVYEGTRLDLTDAPARPGG
jgi:hypothetical protein